MKYEYELGKFTLPYFHFIFSDNKYIKVNLVKYFPNYRLVRNSVSDEYWDYTIIKANDSSLINTIKAFKYTYLKIKGLQYMEFSCDDLLYRKSSQLEYDRHQYESDKESDNGKLYHEFRKLRSENFRETIL